MNLPKCISSHRAIIRDVTNSQWSYLGLLKNDVFFPFVLHMSYVSSRFITVSSRFITALLVLLLNSGLRKISTGKYTNIVAFHEIEF